MNITTLKLAFLCRETVHSVSHFQMSANIVHVIKAVAMDIITTEHFYSTLTRSEFLHTEVVYQ